MTHTAGASAIHESAIYDNVLGLAPAETPLSTARVVLVRAPYDGTTSYAGGSKDGPDAIVAATKQVELYDPELQREPYDVGIHLLPSFLPEAASGPEDVVAQVHARCAGVVAAGKVPFLLGGEHSLTLGNVRACAESYPALSVLQIDAHLDLRDSYEGSGYSHACIGARLLELTPRLQHVGVRCACREEMAALAEHGLKPIWGHELGSSAFGHFDAVIERVLSALSDDVYVTFDVDGLDPSVMPATGTPVPGGLSYYQALRLLRRVGDEKRVRGFDLMELSPGLAPHHATFTAAQLAYKMIGYFVRPLAS